MTEDTLNGGPDEDTRQEESDGETNSSWESRYKELQSFNTKTTQKNKELEQSLAEMKGQLSVLTQTLGSEKPEPAKDWLSEEVDPVKLIDNPEELVGVLGRLRSDIASQILDVLEKRDQAYDEKLKSVSPQELSKNKLIAKYSAEIEELRQDEELSELSDYALAKMIERTSKKSEEDDMGYTPNIGGRRNVQTSGSNKKFDAAVRARLEKMYPGYKID